MQKNYEKHCGGLPRGWRRKASKERFPAVVIALALANIVTYFLIFTKTVEVLALVLGSELANHFGIVLAFFIYIHFVPNLKFGAKVGVFI